LSPVQSTRRRSAWPRRQSFLRRSLRAVAMFMYALSTCAARSPRHPWPPARRLDRSRAGGQPIWDVGFALGQSVRDDELDGHASSLDCTPPRRNHRHGGSGRLARRATSARPTRVHPDRGSGGADGIAIVPLSRSRNHWSGQEQRSVSSVCPVRRSSCRTPALASSRLPKGQRDSVPDTIGLRDVVDHPPRGR
jgi:hypothetical protein